MKCAWIAKHSKDFPVAVLCRFMDISRSRYYDWLNALKTEREKENEPLLDILTALFQKSRGTYGTRRLKREFAKLGYVVSRRRIGRLMNQAGLACKTKKKFKATTDSKHTKPIAPNLLDRQFTVPQPDRSCGRYYLHCHPGRLVIVGGGH